ncbi:unnamed protein product [Closterium sp. NIES-53]
MASEDPIVQIEDEPLHKIVFSNDRVRVFSATIPAGAETLFHRHACNTYFIAVSGGGYRKQIYGQEWLDTALPSRVGFCANYTTHPEIHRVISLQNNPEPMYIVAVEAFPSQPGPEAPAAVTDSAGVSEPRGDILQKSSPLKGAELKGSGWERDKNGEWPDIAIHHLTLQPGQSTGKHAIPFHGVWISLTDGDISGSGDGGPFWSELGKAGASVYWQRRDDVELSNEGPSNYEAVLLELL